MESDALDLLTQLGATFTFRKRPIPIPYDMRADYRIAIILLMLRYCGWKGQAPLAKLHVLNWAHRTTDGQRALLDRLDGNLHMRGIQIKFDPAFSRAIDLSRGEGLIERTESHALVLTPSGNAWLDEIESDASCLVQERNFFESVGMRLKNSILKSILNPSSIW
ncbi:MAG: hypothetical protein V4672_21200 [Verrucomicrobiota bacterium]